MKGKRRLNQKKTMYEIASVNFDVDRGAVFIDRRRKEEKNQEKLINCDLENWHQTKRGNEVDRGEDKEVKKEERNEQGTIGKRATVEGWHQHLRKNK